MTTEGKPRPKVSYEDRKEIEAILARDTDGVAEALYELFDDIAKYGRLVIELQAELRQRGVGE